MRPLLAVAALLVMPGCAQSPSPATAAAPAAATVATPPPSPTDAMMRAGRQFAVWILNNQIDSVVARMAPGDNVEEARTHLTRLVQDIAMRAGSEVKVVEERMIKRNGRDQYWRTAEFERAPEAVLLRIVVTPQGQYAGVGIGLASNPPPIDP